jgi:hypothetical protein
MLIFKQKWETILPESRPGSKKSVESVETSHEGLDRGKQADRKK